jgi:two-component system sensor histidine kinase ChvG
LLVLSLFFGIWRNLHGFARLAQDIGDGSRNRDTSFRDLNQVPELTSVASEFDRMVDRVAASAEAIRDAAEENAHAFKTPIAAIAQSVEPLKRSVPQTDERGQRALQLIEKATERLDTLVNAARQMDEAIADLIRPPRDPVEFSRLLGRMLDAYGEAARLAMKRIRGDVAQNVVVAGSEDMFEIIVENLLDNALSFAPPGSEITVTLTREDDTANLEVADRGPGVESDNLERIFERYFSYHGTTSQPGGIDPNAGHFGMGLWIARRNVESIGGTIQARNRPRGGLRVMVSLPVYG